MTSPDGATPIREAATVMLVRRAPLEVFMLRRNPSAVWVGGAHLFPGGALDPEDRDPRVAARCVGLDDATLIGGPPKMVEGELADLRRADGIILDAVSAKTRLASWSAVDSLGNRASFSSKGPTVDGRIKPDLAAQGVQVAEARPGLDHPTASFAAVTDFFSPRTPRFARFTTASRTTCR